jgi:flagellar biosynthesis protein FlhF
MRVKTFRGRSTSEALHQVRQSLGAEAIILNTQTLEEDGREVCEVVAAVEPKNGQAGGDGAQEPEPNRSWEAWHNEWNRFKEQLFVLLKPQMDLSRLSPRQRLAMEYLEKEGVGSELMLRLWERLRDRPDASSLAELSQLIPVKPWQPKTWPQKAHALIGPHGVGKTTSILRLALDHKQRRPSDRICLVNADGHQGKGRLLLKHYAELSDLGYREAERPTEWGKLVGELGSFDRIFLDLPGLGGEASPKQWLGSMSQGFRGLCLHLVLSPVYSSRQLLSYTRELPMHKVSSLIWTKLDEACSYAEMLNMGYATGLPASLLTFSPSLKNSTSAARERILWQLVFKHRLPNT